MLIERIMVERVQLRHENRLLRDALLTIAEQADDELRRRVLATLLEIDARVSGERE